MENVLEIKNLNKTFRGKSWAGYATLREFLVSHFQKSKSQQSIAALKNINFTVPEGARVGLMGRNGAGKSTLLKIISRILRPSTGVVKWRGRIGSLLEIGTGFHPELTGRENIFLSGVLLGMSRAEIAKHFDEIVEFAEISEFLNLPVKHYSSGMYMRLAFSVAAHLNTEILLIDEVLAVGDQVFQKKCLGKMEASVEAGKTLIFVSHNLGALKRLCSRGLYLKNGELQFDGPIDEAASTYLQDIENESGAGNQLELESENAEIKLTSFRVLDAHGRAQPFAMTGEPLHFEFEILSEKTMQRCVFSIGIDSASGVRTTLLTNISTGESIDLKMGRNLVRCRIPKWPFIANDYFLSLKITGPSGVLIWAPKAIRLNVSAGDYFKKGSLLEEAWVGTAYVEQIWENT